MDFTDNVKTQNRLGDNQEVIGGIVEFLTERTISPKVLQCVH